MSPHPQDDFAARVGLRPQQKEASSPRHIVCQTEVCGFTQDDAVVPETQE